MLAYAPMTIGPKTVVTIDYTLKDDGGAVLDSSDGGKPLVYLHGVGNLVPGLEKALDGKSTGETLSVSLGPDDGYGHRDESLVMNIQVRRLRDKKAAVGLRTLAETKDGVRMVLVTAVRGDYATVDANHPLADMTLHFQVKVVDVREATADEIEHGHIHGEGGHAH